MDKLQILNRALAATGNTIVNVLNDGSDEWMVADMAFDRAIEDLISRHRWPFAAASFTPSEVATNPSERYENAFALPPTVFHVKSVNVDGYQTNLYEIIGRTLSLDTDASGLVTVAYIGMPESSAWHPQAAEILTQMVEVGCLRGLNEDFDEADSRHRWVESRLIEARSTVDQQNPARNQFQSTIRDARRQRRI